MEFISLCYHIFHLYALFSCRSWWSKQVELDRQQDPPHLVLCSSLVKDMTKVERPFLDKDNLHKSYSVPCLHMWTLEFLSQRFGLSKIGTIQFKHLPYFAASLGFLQVLHKRNYSWPYSFIGSLSVAHICILPELAFSSLAEVELGREYGGTHLHHFCCKIKYWIHREIILMFTSRSD